MTNEEKAMLEYPVKQAGDVKYYFDVNQRNRQIFLSACEWKDKQFKEYLEKKRAEKSLGSPMEEYGVGYKDGIDYILDEIINELFGGEANDRKRKRL